MKLIQLSISTTLAASDAVINQLMEAGSYGVQVIDLPYDEVTIQTYFEPAALPPEKLAALQANIAHLKTFGIDLGTNFDVKIAHTDSQKWENTWKKYYHVNRITNRTTIVPSWEDYTPQKASEIVLTLDPQKAFGTGMHPTTSLMIAAMEQVITTQKSLMDVGTGSGILAIMAKKLGVNDVWAADISDDAIVAAKTNFSLNEVSGAITLVKNNLLSGVDKMTDVIVANILPQFLIPLIKQIDIRLNPNGLVLLSGIIQKACPQVETSLRKNGFCVSEKIIRGDWVVLIAHRQSEEE